ncbi:MAG: hypothetical protein LKF61_01885 [Eggerthellaceae bacterium]|nr:hypothetical protein [Eggerthellaceae bacterium]MCH4221153.1 hypothetical protein [Eggerthellaceae bacterium]
MMIVNHIVAEAKIYVIALVLLCAVSWCVLPFNPMLQPSYADSDDSSVTVQTASICGAQPLAQVSFSELPASVEDDQVLLFTIAANDGAPAASAPTGSALYSADATVGSTAPIDFGTITFTAPGQYTYTIARADDTSNVITTMDAQVVTVIVTSDSNNTLYVSAVTSADPTSAIKEYSEVIDCCTAGHTFANGNGVTAASLYTVPGGIAHRYSAGDLEAVSSLLIVPTGISDDAVVLGQSVGTFEYAGQENGMVNPSGISLGQTGVFDEFIPAGKLAQHRVMTAQISPDAMASMTIAKGDSYNAWYDSQTTSAFAQREYLLYNVTYIDADYADLNGALTIDGSIATAAPALAASSESAVSFESTATLDNVFVGSTTASDNSSQIAASDAASGASPSKAVSSFAHAKSLLNKGGTIWVVGPIDVPEAQMWDMAGMAADGTGSGSLKRWDGTTVSFTDQADTNPFTTDSMVVLSAAASQLSVTNMTIDGNKVPVSITTNTSVTSDHGPAVSLRSTGSFTLGSGATIKDVDLSTAGGYWVQGGAISNYHGGTVTMNAGSLISGCKSEVGSAVWCSGTSVFNMTGGSISGCGGINNNQSGGEVVILNDSVFNMSGGSITHNTASDSGFCAVNLRTGGTLNMSGTASITDNGLIGVYKAASTTIKLSGGATIDNNTRSTSPANIYCQATVDASGTPTNPIYVTGALTGKIGIRVVSADHVQGHEFALGDSYTVTDTDAAVFSDDNTPALTIARSSDANVIRFVEDTPLDNVFLGSLNAADMASRIAASDSNDGSSPSCAVASFARAKSLLKQGGTIWAVGPVEISDAQTWDLSGCASDGMSAGSLKRWDGTSITFDDNRSTAAYKGPFAIVRSHGILSLSQIVVDGNKDATKATDALVKILGGTTYLLSGSVLKNNAIADASVTSAAGITMDDGKLGLSNGSIIQGNEGGQIGGIDCRSSLGTAEVLMVGGLIEDNVGSSVGALYAESGSTSVDIQSGSILRNTATDNGGVGAIRLGSTDNGSGVSLKLSGRTFIEGNVCTQVEGGANGPSVGGVCVSKGASCTVADTTVINSNTIGTTQSDVNGLQSGSTASNLSLSLGTSMLITDALSDQAHVGVTTAEADHVRGHEFAFGTGYTITDTDAAACSDDCAPAFAADISPDNNAICFSSSAEIVLTGVGENRMQGGYSTLSGATFNLYKYVGSDEISTETIDSAPLAGTDASVWEPVAGSDESSISSEEVPVTYVSGDDGVLKDADGATLPAVKVDTYYALVETGSSSGYTTPTSQWVMKATDNNDVTSVDVSNSLVRTGADGSSAPALASSLEVNGTTTTGTFVVNQSSFALPYTGSVVLNAVMLFGMGCATLVLAVIARVVYRRLHLSGC